MNILIIGGTQFLGRYIAEYGIKRGHDISFFNRGKSDINLYEGHELIKGDRTGDDILKLQNRTWDAVIDTCCYFPVDAERMAKVLEGNTEQYIFISSASVYKSDPEKLTDEESEILDLPEGVDPNERVYDYYGEKKYLCEREIINVFKDKSLIIRPGLIVGPHDQSYRFPYWPERFHEGGRILLPGDKNAPIQIIDVRDLAEWIIKMAENRENGVFNAEGPRDLTRKKFFDLCSDTIPSEKTFVWVPDEILIKHEIREWLEIPLWLTEENIHMFKTDNSKAVKHGLVFRELESTILDTLEWSKTVKNVNYRKQALSRKTEEKILRENSF